MTPKWHQVFCASTGISSSWEAAIRFLWEVCALKREGQQSREQGRGLGHSVRGVEPELPAEGQPVYKYGREAVSGLQLSPAYY